MKPNQGKQFLRDQRQHPDDMSHASPSDMARCVQRSRDRRGQTCCQVHRVSVGLHERKRGLASGLADPCLVLDSVRDALEVACVRTR